MFPIQAATFEDFKQAIQNRAESIGFNLGQTTTCFSKKSSLKHFSDENITKVKNGYFYCRGRRKECPFSLYFKYDLNHKLYIISKEVSYHNHDLRPCPQVERKSLQVPQVLQSTIEVDFETIVLPKFENTQKRNADIMVAVQGLKCDMLLERYSLIGLNKARDIYSRVRGIKNLFARARIMSNIQQTMANFLSKVFFHHYRKDHVFLTVEAIQELVKADSNVLTVETYVLGFILFIKKFDAYCLELALELNINQIKEIHRTIELCMRLLQNFSFRNGILRRNFDGVKYVLKNAENIVYELTTVKRLNTTQSTVANMEDSGKKRSLEDLENHFELVVKLYEAEDSFREDVIKKTRDVLKNAKKAVFKIQQDKFEEGFNLICLSVEQLNKIKEYPKNQALLFSIAQYMSSIEELVEAILFYNWCVYHSKDLTLSQSGLYGASLILTFKTLKTIIKVNLSVDSYLGGISDFTGEIGRVGVKAAAKRDISKIRSVINTMKIAQSSLLGMFRKHCPRKFQEKKLHQLDVNLQKMNRILYEQIVIIEKDKMLTDHQYTTQENNRQLLESLPQLPEITPAKRSRPDGSSEIPEVSTS